MNTQVLEPPPVGRTVWPALAVAGVLLFFTNADSFSFALGAARPVVWVVLFTACTGLLLVLNPRRGMRVLESPVVAWAFVYFLVTTAWAVWTNGRLEVLQELHDRWRSVAFLCAFAVVFDDPRARRSGMLTVAACVVLASALNVAELLSLITFPKLPGLDRVIGRAAGLYVNPNVSGIAIALGTALTATALPRALRAPLLVVAAAGVASTFSRGAMIALAVAFVWLLMQGALGRWRSALAVAGVALVLVFGAEYLRAHDMINDNTAARLALSEGDSGRTALAAKAWDMFLASPLVGNGLGSTLVWDAPARPHNTFAALAADHGVIGLLALPSLALAVVASCGGGGIAFALALLSAGLFSDTLLADRFALLLMALAAARASAPVVVEDEVRLDGVARLHLDDSA